MPPHYSHEVLKLGYLDLPDNHPDGYTGKVTHLHKKGTEFGDIELYAETKTGQPVPLCTIDCENLLALMLDEKHGEVITRDDMPHGCKDYAEVMSAFQEALKMLKTFSVSSSTKDKHAACDFLSTYTKKAQ